MQQQEQQQQQTVATSPGVVQPTHVSHPYVIVESYRDRQSAVIGIVLIIAGSLSIVFSIVDIVIDSHYTSDYGKYGYIRLSNVSVGVVGDGFWCGIMVSIRREVGIFGLSVTQSIGL